MHRPSARLPALLLLPAVLLTGSLASGQAAKRDKLFPPADLGMLESADRDVWQKPDLIMDSLGIADRSKVADVGAGGGYFTVRLARRVGPAGVVWAEDVQPAMLEAIRRRVGKENLGNVRYVQGAGSDPMLPADALDAVLILETYQEIQYVNPLLFLQNVRAALRKGGRVGIVDYKRGGGGPGPDGVRPDPETIVAVAEQAGLRLLKRETFLPFQFFLVFVK
jgi:ubiquinone/menaquinone biosynthesis C-methylase UbiE